MWARVKLLPVTIIVAFMLLGVKIGDVWEGAGALVGSVEARGAENPPAEETVDEAMPATMPRAPTAADVIDISPEEVRLLENLAERREQLDARVREIDMREKLLAAAEARVDDKIGELKQIEVVIRGLVEEFDERQQTKIKSLVKIYETMKPKDAARIFNQLEMAVLLEVIGGMRESKSAAIIARMDASKAKEVTSELAIRETLPDPDGIID